MDVDQAYFPWDAFQLWLREGFRAGALLNKVMVASWPKEQRPFAPTSEPEEVELLRNVVAWAKASGNDNQLTSTERLASLQAGSDYPALSDEDARALWLTLSAYGTLSERYRELQPKLRKYMASFGADMDNALQNGMNCLWRSIGPALDPDRKNIEKAA